jgi:hypothetical protein
MPKTIGESPEEGAIPAAAGQVEDPIAALMAQVAFEEEDVKDTLAEFFDWMSERFKSDHWKLTDRQSRILGRPSAQLLNSIWAKLQDYLPDILARWCETTPGATAFILACGIVVLPKAKKQFTISRERRKPGPRLVPRPGQTTATPVGSATTAPEDEQPPRHFPSGITYSD